MKKALFLVGIAACTLLLTCCYYHHARTDQTYMLNKDYDLFEIDEHPQYLPNDFVGFCPLPLETPSDPRGRAAVELVSRYLENHGYKRVLRDELLANQKLIDKTFMLGVGYRESFSYDELELNISLYYLDKKQRKNVPFYAANTKFDGYPLNRNAMEPVLEDLFKETPMWDDEGDPIFPSMNAPSNIVEQYVIDLAIARRRCEDERVLK